MKRRSVAMAAVVIYFGATLSAAPAGVAPGVVTAIVACQIELPIFPAVAISAGTHKCGGGADTDVAGIGGPGKDNAAGGGCVWMPLVDRKPLGNVNDGNADVCPGPSATNAAPSREGGFNAYDIFYNNICIPGDIMPSQGAAVGDAWINNYGLPSLAEGALRFRFVYTRIGIAWIATLLDMQQTWQRFYSNGARPGTPPTPGFGVAAGLFFLAGLPFGTCAAPGPTTIWLIGAAVGTL